VTQNNVSRWIGLYTVQCSSLLWLTGPVCVLFSYIYSLRFSMLWHSLVFIVYCCVIFNADCCYCSQRGLSVTLTCSHCKLFCYFQRITLSVYFSLEGLTMLDFNEDFCEDFRFQQGIQWGILWGFLTRNSVRNSARRNSVSEEFNKDFCEEFN